MDRRNFLHAAALAAAYPAARLYAAPATSTRFLLVFLRGAYDATSLLVPTASSFYYESRPTIAIARPDPNDPRSAVALDSNWGLHPALRDSIEPLYQRKQIAFVPFAGTNDTSRSHFETQDSIEAGLAAQSLTPVVNGFLYRLSRVLGASPIAFTDTLPTILKGDNGVANISLKGVGKPAFDDHQSNVLSAMYKGSALEAPVHEGLNLRQEVAHEFDQEMQMASRGAVSAKGFELEARRIARLMHDHYQIGFVDIGGWDTHVNQGGAQGQLANNLGNLGRGLAGFAEEMGPMWQKTVVVVLSEFGRTFRENGSHGTDHGHGSVYWVAGGGLQARSGGSVVGDQVALQASTLFQNRDNPVLNEYRSLLAGLFGRMYGLSNSDLDKVFAGVQPRDYQLV